MTKYHSYLDRLMTERGLANHELAAMVGASRQAIYKLRRGLTRMQPDWAKRLAGPLGVSWQELVEEKPQTDDQDRADLLAAYDAMDDEQRRALLAIVKVMVRGDIPPASVPHAPQGERAASTANETSPPPQMTVPRGRQPAKQMSRPRTAA